MADQIFDGCVAATSGIQDCRCEYCTYITALPDISWPDNYPDIGKDLRAVKFLMNRKQVREQEGRLNNQFTRLEKTEALAKKLDDKLSAPTATPAATVDYQPKINELDTKAKKLETSVGTLSGSVDSLSGKSQTLEQRVASIETLKIVERLTELEKKVKP